MFRTMLVVLVTTLVMSFSAFAGNTQRANLTASMECNACKNKIEKTLKNTKGVEKVNIDLKTQSVKVDYDKDVVDEAQLIKAINTADTKFSAKVADANSPKNIKNDCSKSCDKKCNKK